MLGKASAVPRPSARPAEHGHATEITQPDNSRGAHYLHGHRSGGAHRPRRGADGWYGIVTLPADLREAEQVLGDPGFRGLLRTSTTRSGSCSCACRAPMGTEAPSPRCSAVPGRGGAGRLFALTHMTSEAHPGSSGRTVPHDPRPRWNRPLGLRAAAPGIARSFNGFTLRRARPGAPRAMATGPGRPAPQADSRDDDGRPMLQRNTAQADQERHSAGVRFGGVGVKDKDRTRTGGRHPPARPRPRVSTRGTAGAHRDRGR